MGIWTKKKIRRLNLEWHRDLGYLFSGLLIVYCLSGIALNHIDDWNPDFIIKRTSLTLSEKLERRLIDSDKALELSKMVGEERFKIFDFPNDDHVKIYYDNASLHIDFTKGKAVYEQITKRPFFYQTNILHRNSLKGWRWYSDFFAFTLIVITVTGLFIAKGKHGLSQRGKWLVLAGIIPPVIAIIIQSIL